MGPDSVILLRSGWEHSLGALGQVPNITDGLSQVCLHKPGGDAQRLNHTEWVGRGR